MVLQKGRSNLTVSVWKDKKLVHHLSTLSKPDTIEEAPTCHGPVILKLTQPANANAYNKHMCGVDRHDALHMKYDVGRNSKKWWRYLFWFLVNSAIVNAYIIYKQVNRHHHSKKRYSHID